MKIINNKKDAIQELNRISNRFNSEKNIKTIKRSVDGIFFHVPYKNGIALKRPHSAVRKGDYKLIKFQDDKSIFLFNLVKDKMEQINLATQKPEIAKKLEKIFQTLL